MANVQNILLRTTYTIRKTMLISFSVLLLAAIFGCETGSVSEKIGNVRPPVAARPPISDKPKIIAYGNSLTAGFGLDTWEKSYPALLQKTLDSEGYDFQVLNYGVGGDTAERGLARLYLASEIGNTRIFVLELGANDIAKMAPADQIRINLSSIIERLKAKKFDILLCGYKRSVTNGSDYDAEIDRMYQEIAAEYQIPLMHDFLASVSNDANLMMDDSIHPNEAGVRVIERNVFNELQPILIKYERVKK
jgi:acyl-CoA thioesterase I